VPEEFGNWSTVYDRFRQWRDAGVFQALMESVIVEAARRGQVDLSLVSVDSTTARAHHDAAGMRVDAEVLAALEKAVAEEKVPLWLSSSRSCCGGLVEGPVSEHGEQDVDAPSGQCDEGSDVVFSLAAFAVVVGP
jgi:hypothetical protein